MFQGKSEIYPEGESEIYPGQGESEILPEGESEIYPEGESEILPDQGKSEILPKISGDPPGGGPQKFWRNIAQARVNLRFSQRGGESPGIQP